MPRYALLEHTGAPEDPAGRHFELLLEAGPACRTWRLMVVPTSGGDPVPALELPPHRLEWLERLEGDVSGGRGHARRVDAGSYALLSSDADELTSATAIVVGITGSILTGRLRLETVGDGWAVRLA